MIPVRYHWLVIYGPVRTPTVLLLGYLVVIIIPVPPQSRATPVGWDERLERVETPDYPGSTWTRSRFRAKGTR